MNYYELLFCNSKYQFCLCVLLVASFFLSLPVASAQETITVEIAPNQSVNANVDFEPFWNQEFLKTDAQWTADAPTDAANTIESGTDSFNDIGYFDAPKSAPPMLPINGASDILRNKTRYIGLSLVRFATYEREVQTPYKNYGNNTDEKKINFTNWLAYPQISFRYEVFYTDLSVAVLGSQNYEWLKSFLNTLAALPTGADFTYSVPAIFGFDSGFVINVPLNSILSGSGEWAYFAIIFQVIRAIFGVCYYTSCFVLIVRCLAFYQ